jgi:hypothetical protein
MMQYRNGLIGKHFKTLMQTTIFHLHGLVTPDQFTLVKAMGFFGALLWIPEIEDMESYLVCAFSVLTDLFNHIVLSQADLTILVGNVLDAFASIDPSKIILKMKLQLLADIIEDIRRHGPAIRFSTEIFECFNAIFRLCSIFSNRQAPSRDIAHKFASMDRVKHILSGGYWKHNNEWVQAGGKVRSLLHNKPVVQRHLGWAPQKVIQCGMSESTLVTLIQDLNKM